MIGISSLTLLTIGCGPDLKAIECQVLREAHQKGFDKAIFIRPFGSLTYDHSIEKQMASSWTSSAQNIAKLEISDTKLKKIQEELIAAYQHAGEQTSQAAALIPTNNQVDEVLSNQIEKFRRGSIGQMDRLSQDIHLYCKN